MILVKYLVDLVKAFLKLLIFKIKNLNKPLRIRFIEQNSRKALIMGNGPSLNNDLPEILNYSKNVYDIFAVNFFSNTKTFYQIKPNYYFLADKLFWSSNLNDDFNSLVNYTYDSISKVNWKISILCPESGYNFIKSKLDFNSNISFILIPERPIELFSENFFLKLLEKRFFSIPNVNSVVTLIWYSILCNYKEVSLYGIDFSGFKFIEVNQNTNEVNVPVKHFYKNSKAENNSSKKYTNQNNKTLSQRLLQNYLVFNYLDILSKMAKSNNINIFNKSSFSYVDSFKRSSNLINHE